MKQFKALVSLSICGLLMASCSNGGGGTTPEATAKKFIEYSYKGDADTVISMIYLSEKDKQEAGIQEMLQGKVKAGVAKEKIKAEQLGGIDEITTGKFEAFKNNKERGQVPVETRFKKGDVIKNRVKVIQTDEGWKVFL